MPRRRAIAETNIGIAFPEMKDEDRKKQIILRSFGNLALGILHMIWIKEVTRESIGSLVEVDQGSEGHIRKAFEKGKGVLVLMGHFGNWELMGLFYGFNDLPPTHCIARKLDNPYLEKRLRQFRMASGNGIIYKTDAAKGILRALKKNECVGILIDQNFARNEIFVDFFGKKAATTRLLASISLSTGAPIIPATSYPLENGRFRTVYSPEITIKSTGNKKEDAQLLTQKCTHFLQGIIQKCPEGWMWGHRRWKKRPHGEPPVYKK